MEKYTKDPKKKRIVFLTGTRADFGKIKSLILELKQRADFDVHTFVTGMHMQARHGYTVDEVEKSKMPNIYKYINHVGSSFLESTLASTLIGFGNYIKEFKPDLVVVHGDRIEALGGALAGSLNNILVAHIEGGELSGTIDEHIRHAISKVSHIHFVANRQAKNRLIQMGEKPKSVFVTGSPDIDIMLSPDLPSLKTAKKRYGIKFDKFAIIIHHAVTNEIDVLNRQVNVLTDCAKKSGLNYVVIYPNNDPGTDIIQNIYEEKLANDARFKVFPSIRFEYFLTLLKNAQFIIGNSSTGIREAPHYGVPAINIGTRQKNRVNKLPSIFNSNFNEKNILTLMENIVSNRHSFKPTKLFGHGKSRQNFLKIITRHDMWKTKVQKQFRDIKFT